MAGKKTGEDMAINTIKKKKKVKNKQAKEQSIIELWDNFN